MTNLLLLDLDGTVRRCKSDPAAFINLPFDQQIIPEADAAMHRWADAGALIVGCSNQAGVSAGYKSIGECIDEHLETMRLAPQISAVLFSPDSDGNRCFIVSRDGSVLTLHTRTLEHLHIRSFRKPACGMLKAAMERSNADLASTVFVGDRDEDRLAAISAGVNYMPETVWWESYPKLTAPAAAA